MNWFYILIIMENRLLTNLRFLQHASIIADF